MVERIADATGQKFHKITILQDKLPDQKSLIKCDCGIEKLVRRYDVFDGKIKSCGATKCAGKWIDISDQIFDQLFVTKYIGLSLNKKSIIWECQCSCGNSIETSYISLVTGHKKSCGCIKSERISRAQAMPIKTVAEKELYNVYKQNAKKRQFVFEISKIQFVSFLYDNCYYCDATPTNFIKKKRVTGTEIHYFNGVDRVNNEIGYVLDNCVTCCKICNIAKNNLTMPQFLSWLEQINSNFLKIKNKIETCNERKINSFIFKEI